MQPSARAIEILAILQWPRVGPVAVRNVLARFRAGDSLVDLTSRAAPNVSDPDKRRAIERARIIVEQCADQGILIFSPGDQSYPRLLERIPDFPPIIYVKGDPKALEQPAIAIVGTRQASSTGLRLAHLLAERATTTGLTVVSGLALGIDAAAHEGALNVQGRTVAVLAHGLDIVAPRTNSGLAARILGSAGALVSEHPPGVPPRPPEFVRRNRIQSGMSLASVVVESGATGGAMHQAGFTVKQRRRLFTILASTDDPGSDFVAAGAHRLISEFGATPLRTAHEIDRALESIHVSEPPPSPPAEPRQGELL